MDIFIAYDDAAEQAKSNIFVGLSILSALIVRARKCIMGD